MWSSASSAQGSVVMLAATALARVGSSHTWDTWGG